MAVIDLERRKLKREAEKQYYDDPHEILTELLELPPGFALVVVNVNGRLRLTRMGRSYNVEV